LSPPPTTTGNGRLKKKLPMNVSKIYYQIEPPPNTSPGAVAGRPEAIILVEAKSGQFIWRAQQQRIPLFLVNARFRNAPRRGYNDLVFCSDRSSPRSLAWVRKPSRRRAVAANSGCRPEAVQVVGSLKFDAATLDGPRTLDVTDDC